VAAAGMDAAGNAVAGLLSMVAATAYRQATGSQHTGAGLAVLFRSTLHIAVDWQGLLGRSITLVTLLLQLVPYSLTGGAGVNMGIAAFR